MKKLHALQSYLFIALLAYVPFHVFLTTWIGSSVGSIDYARAVLDVVLAVGFLSLFVNTNRKELSLLKKPLFILMSSYVVLTLLLALVKDTDPDAELIGISHNLRFFVMFAYGVVIASRNRASYITQALKIVFGMSLVVATIAVAQYVFLPDDLFESFGYSTANGVFPVFYIDNNPDFERAMSTLRDPNSLGSYLLLPLGYFLYLTMHSKKHRKTYTSYLLLILLALVVTFSRSAWLASFGVIGVLLAFNHNIRARLAKHRKNIVLFVGAALIVGVIGIVGLRESNTFKNIFYHASEETVLESPNEIRARVYWESTLDIVDEPLGHGPGTAGLASIKNDRQGTILNENYYLQIGHEIGVLGLMILVTILILVGKRLYELRHARSDALVLLAVLVGLSLTNMLVHIWSNESVALTFWGLTGVVLSSGLTKNKTKNSKRSTSR